MISDFYMHIKQANLLHLSIILKNENKNYY